MTQHFHSSIATEKGVFNFYFNKVETTDGNRYHVSVIDRLGKAIIFLIHEINKEWLIIPAPEPPDWIMSLQEKLGEVIRENN